MTAGVFACTLVASTAHAEDVDTTYGRIDGDLGLAVGGGATIAARGPRAAVDLRLRYLDTAGLFLTYEDGPLLSSSAEPVRVAAGGLELRPLFLGRWLQGMEVGSARLDLALDSLGIELGAVVGQPRSAAFASRPGFQVGLGLELPVLAQASGPWIGLHGGVRWAASALEGQPVNDADDRALYLTITVSYHQMFGAHFVDLGDRRPR